MIVDRGVLLTCITEKYTPETRKCAKLFFIRLYFKKKTSYILIVSRFRNYFKYTTNRNTNISKQSSN